MVSAPARQRLAAARAWGRVGGRPRAMTALTVRAMMATLRDKAKSVTELAKELGIHRATVYDYVRPDGTPTPLGQALLAGRALHPAPTLAEAAD